MEQDLEKRIIRIALKEVGKDNFRFPKTATSCFNTPVPYSELAREQRMRNFISYYEEHKSCNTTNLIYIPPSPPGWPLSEEQVTNMDYRNFFLEGIDDMQALPASPPNPANQDFGELFILHGEIYRDFCCNPEMARLGNVKQLGTVTNFIPFVGLLGHDRYCHSLLTAALTESVLARNGFGKDDIILGIAAGLMHDLPTAAFSEQGKLAARKELDEEKLVGWMVQKSEGLKQLIGKYKVNLDDLIGVVQGSEKLGGVINSKGIDVDKISYVIGDYSKVQSYFPERFNSALFNNAANLFGIYRDIVFRDGAIVFEDPEKALRFLQLRATLYQEVYLNPFNRAKEAFLARELPKLWGSLLDIDKITAIGDEDFELLVKSAATEGNKQLFNDLFDFIGLNFSEIRREYDLSKYEELAKQYTDKNTVVAMQRGPSSGTSTRVMRRGEVRTLKEAFPEKAAVLEEISAGLTYVGVYRYSERGIEWRDKDYYKRLRRRMMELAERF